MLSHFNGLVGNYQISGMSRNKPGISGIQVYQEYRCIRSIVCTEIYQVVIKMSGHHSHYRDNYKSQVYHAGCQVIA